MSELFLKVVPFVDTAGHIQSYVLVGGCHQLAVLSVGYICEGIKSEIRLIKISLVFTFLFYQNTILFFFKSYFFALKSGFCSINHNLVPKSNFSVFGLRY